ncbi:MAG: DUF2294 domain-containing protein [Bacteroidetes bacterium]|nr:DUF2294 domain-containing protein [Bacteroidota bacterium]
MNEQTKGQIEAKISEEITLFEKNFMGRGPHEIKTFIIDDIILIRLKGVLTPAENNLSSSPDGAKLVKELRSKLIENSSDYLRTVIQNITNACVKSLLTDISPETGERIFVFTLDINLEETLTSDNPL